MFKRVPSSFPLRLAIAAIAACPLLVPGRAEARARLEGPIPAIVTRVIDGDTIEVRAQVWLEHEILVRVRLAGVDTPEMREPCAEGRAQATAARDRVVREVMGQDGVGARVLLTQILGGKYFGRVIARVITPRGEDLSQLLLAAGLGVNYAGGRREPICREMASRD